MRAFTLCICIGLSVAAFCGAALAWDGSAYLFQLLDTGAPFVAHNRFITLPLHGVVLLAAQLTGNTWLLGIVFGLAYASIPLLALLASWWCVREQAPHLFVWAVLGIALGMLPGQLFLVAEATMAVELFWPIWLALAIGMPARVVPLVIVLAVAVLMCHPFALVLFGLAAMLAWAYGLRFPIARDRPWRSALVFVGLMMLSALATMLSADVYESDQLSLRMLRYAFRSSMVGLPLLGLGCAWLAALLLLIAARLRPPARRLVNAAALLGIGVAGAVLLMWARNAALWKQELDFRYLVVVAAVPFLAMAAIEGLWPVPSEDHAALWRQRLPSAQAGALVFMLVLIVQSVVWQGVTNRLRDTIARAACVCTSTGPIAWVEQTPLRHWSVTAYALLLQGYSPTSLVLAGDGCSRATFSSPTIRIIEGPVRRWDEGRFNLRNLRDDLIEEQANSGACFDGRASRRKRAGQEASTGVLSGKEVSAAARAGGQ